MLYDEKFQTFSMSFQTFNRGFLHEILEKFILEAHQHGIMSCLHRQVYRFGRIEDQIESEPQVLSVFMLSAGFYIWLGTVLIACIVFIAENVKYCVEKSFERIDKDEVKTVVIVQKKALRPKPEN